MDSRGPTSTSADSDVASPVPVHFHYAVRQSDVVGLTLAAVATLLFLFTAILVFHFYRHKKLEQLEDEQRRKARLLESPVRTGIAAAS